MPLARPPARSDNRRAVWPALPRDMFALEGYRANRCYIIPSLDLVVARVGSGPATWDEGGLIGSVVAAIIAEERTA